MRSRIEVDTFSGRDYIGVLAEVITEDEVLPRVLTLTREGHYPLLARLSNIEGALSTPRKPSPNLSRFDRLAYWMTWSDSVEADQGREPRLHRVAS